MGNIDYKLFRETYFGPLRREFLRAADAGNGVYSNAGPVHSTCYPITYTTQLTLRPFINGNMLHIK
jgi:hypothetical protein